MTLDEAMEILDAAATLVQSGAKPWDVHAWILKQGVPLGDLVSLTPAHQLAEAKRWLRMVQRLPGPERDVETALRLYAERCTIYEKKYRRTYVV